VYRTMLKSKIHRATVTQADLHYVGSVTVDPDLMDAADLLPGEQVHIVDIDNGARLETYVIPGERGSGVIGINGAAARLVHTGDLVVTKDVLSAGSTRWAQGGIAAALGPGDSPEEHLRDSLVAGVGLCDVEALRVLVTSGPAAVRRLIDVGARFDAEADGTLALTREG